MNPSVAGLRVGTGVTLSQSHGISKVQHPVVFPDWGLREVRKDASPSTQADTAGGPPAHIAEMKIHTGGTLEISNDK